MAIFTDFGQKTGFWRVLPIKGHFWPFWAPAGVSFTSTPPRGAGSPGGPSGTPRGPRGPRGPGPALRDRVPGILPWGSPGATGAPGGWDRVPDPAPRGVLHQPLAPGPRGTPGRSRAQGGPRGLPGASRRPRIPLPAGEAKSRLFPRPAVPASSPRRGPARGSPHRGEGRIPSPSGEGLQALAGSETNTVKRSLAINWVYNG